jgi:RiboL-PSP-HEPN
MRKNGYSAALRDYEASLGRARRLHRIEIARYRDPPPLADQVAVEALRGGATVLMVASFERYLKEALEEFVDLIAKRALVTSHAKLAPDFVEYNDFNFFNWLIRESRLPRKEKADELKRVAQLVAVDGFVPEAFCRTRANPGPSTVRDLFREFGVRDPLHSIESNFPRHYGRPFPVGFVGQTLTSIVSIRNEVAHGGFSLSISRSDLRAWIGFLSALGRAADNTLRDHALGVLTSL